MNLRRDGAWAEPSTPDPLDQVFGEQGLLARGQSGYQVRPGQLTLVRAIRERLAQGGVGLYEAPCGSGKTYSAAVPLIQRAAELRRREGSDGYRPTVILTKTIALQEQLVRQDLPALQRLLGERWPFSFALLKGRANYVCQRQRARLAEQLQRLDFELEPELLRWVQETTTGDRADCPVVTTGAEWAVLSTQADDCLGGGCPFHRSCFVEQARALAWAADLVVANYHVVLAHGARALGKFRDLVCDEAHDLPDVARSSFGWSASTGSFSRLANFLDDLWGLDEALTSSGWASSGRALPRPAELRQAGERVFMRLLPLLEERGGEPTRLREPGALCLEPVNAMLRAVVQRVGELLEAQEEDDEGDTARFDRETQARLQRLRRGARQLREHLIDAQKQEAEGWVYWLEQYADREGRPRARLEARPFLVREQLQATIFDRQTHPAVILMSATLRTNDGFGFMRRELGLGPAATELVVPSPFDLTRQAVLVIPNYVPAPPRLTEGGNQGNKEQETYWTRSTVALAELVVALGGRTLALFTSWRALDYAWELLAQMQELGQQEPEGPRGVLARLRWLRQESGQPVRPLVQEFMADETSVLLGVRSLWEGLDVPGNALRGLFVQRLPFPNLRDPLNEAMTEWLDAAADDETNEGNGRVPPSFQLWSLPLATRVLQQGVGRLIRRVTDTGVIMIPDQRLTQRRYGADVLAALPRVPRLPSLAYAQRYYAHLFNPGATEVGG